jgi:hypothetical protein
MQHQMNKKKIQMSSSMNRKIRKQQWTEKKQL